mgnify:CR=1 FL=1
MLFERAKSQEFGFSVPIPPASVDKMRNFPAFRSLPHSHSKSKFQTFLYNAFSHNKRGRRMFTLEWLWRSGQKARKVSKETTHTAGESERQSKHPPPGPPKKPKKQKTTPQLSKTKKHVKIILLYTGIYFVPTLFTNGRGDSNAMQ